MYFAGGITLGIIVGIAGNSMFTDIQADQNLGTKNDNQATNHSTNAFEAKKQDEATDQQYLKYVKTNNIHKDQLRLQTANSASQSDIFTNLIEQSFAACDQDGNGKIDEQELYIAILLLYDNINCKLPCHIPVPTKEQVRQYMDSNDEDGDRCLDKNEFTQAAMKILYGTKNPRESITYNVVEGIFIYVVILPLIAYTIQNVVGTAKIPYANNIKRIPSAALAGCLAVMVPTVQQYLIQSNYTRGFKIN
eukprot:TRINITY_DN4646_c0_g1_i2.p2 TRINITY_DN4646_c0_g1~~TRINITY_DN4646_c0_g1_i2.p2  ORF type:complete len:274 (-),score=13.10 TRINITY_DN4646_c0_g1_i2:537-1283(-)